MALALAAPGDGLDMLRGGQVGLDLLPRTVHQRRQELFVAGLDLHRVGTNRDAENLASAWLLERVGMRRDEFFVESLWFKGHCGSELWYAILNNEWHTPKEKKEVRPFVLQRDPNARSWIWGCVTAIFIFILIACLWIVAVNGAIPREVLAKGSDHRHAA